MILNFQIPKFSGNVPWWIYDLTNHQLITTSTIPAEIRDSKGIVLAETTIPGRNFAPIMQSGNTNRKIGLTLKIIKRNNTVGNVMLLKQFDMLRNQSGGFLNILPKQFNPNPKVLYYWGTGSIPLVYYVTKCDFVHTGEMVNEMGNPQYTEVELEMVLDETELIYKGEEVFRRLSSIVATVGNGWNTAARTFGGEKTV